MFPSLVKVILKGVLAKEFGETHHFVAHSPGEAVKALIANFPDFQTRILELESAGFVYRCTSRVRRRGIDQEEMNEPDILAGEFVIRPVLAGSGGVFKTLLGIGLIVAAVAIPFAAVGGGLKLGLLGASLVLSGVSEMLTPKAKKKDDGPKSSSFNSATGTADKDFPIPCWYGYFRISGMPVLSASITTYSI
jgi:predicted phage tail protein